jgi:fructose-bisphosphate aldolase class II
VLKKADKGGYAVGAFNINNLEILRAVVDTAVEERSPVIVQTSEGAIAYAGMDYLVALMRVAAKAPVPVVMHLDHGKDLDVVRKAINAGYTSVMYDGSTLPYKENVRNTKKVVGWAKKHGVSVEAEIGAISGIEDLVNVSEREAAFTDPDEARRFAADTGCDALAVSIGTAHGAMKSKAQGAIALDIDRLKKIDAAVKVPLVLHGASGVNQTLIVEAKKYCASYEDCQRLSGAKGIPDEEIERAIKAGIRKINIDSDLRIAFTAGIRDALMEDKTAIDPRKHMKIPMRLMADVVRHKMRLFGSAGKA